MSQQDNKPFQWDDEIVTYIYTLAHPVSGEVRYVGKTVNIRNRYYAHCSVSKRDKSRRCQWIRGLISTGLLPLLEILDEGVHKWEELEQYWICQFRTWGFNLLNDTDGGDFFPDSSKVVYQYSLNGVFIQSHKSTTAASKSTSIPQTTISKCALGDYQRAGRFIWSYDQVFRPKRESHRAKAVMQISKSGELIKEFPSLALAEQEVGQSRHNIRKVCQGKQITAGGYKWKFKNTHVSVKNIPKSVLMYDTQATLIMKFDSLQKAENHTGLKKGSISRVCHDGSNRLGGYLFSFDPLASSKIEGGK